MWKYVHITDMYTQWRLRMNTKIHTALIIKKHSFVFSRPQVRSKQFHVNNKTSPKFLVC